MIRTATTSEDGDRKSSAVNDHYQNVVNNRPYRIYGFMGDGNYSISRLSLSKRRKQGFHEEELIIFYLWGENLMKVDQN